MWLESIQRVIDYIEDHLEDSLDLNVLTKVAQMQAYPLQRAFSLLAMMTLPEYIRGRRLTLAAQQLTQTDEKSSISPYVLVTRRRKLSQKLSNVSMVVRRR